MNRQLLKHARWTTPVIALVFAVTAVVVPAKVDAASGCVAFSYSYGGYSTCISYIQRMLNGLRVKTTYSHPWSALTVDNSFGSNTRAAVKNFQLSVGLSNDGIVGPNTWTQLCGQVWEVKVINQLPIQDGYAAGDSANCVSIYSNYHNN